MLYLNQVQGYKENEMQGFGFVGVMGYVVHIEVTETIEVHLCWTYSIYFIFMYTVFRFINAAH